jgi:hypothetical protein
LSFILILIVTIEIIGAYFVRQLEDQNVASFETSVQVPAYTLNQISENLTDNDQHTRENIGNAIQDYSRVSTDITDVQVVDRSGIIVGAKDSDGANIVGTQTLKDNIKQSIRNDKKITQIYYEKITVVLMNQFCRSCRQIIVRLLEQFMFVLAWNQFIPVLTVSF